MKRVVELVRMTALGVLFSVLIVGGSVRAELKPFVDTFSDGVLDSYWTTFSTIPGAEIEETDGRLKITVPNTVSGWRDAGIRSKETFGLQDFECSVDFRVPQGRSMAWLRTAVTSETGQGLANWSAYYYDEGARENYYCWYRNTVGSGWLGGRSAFGDEDSNWHTFKLVYDAETMNASAFVDDMFLNSKVVDLAGFQVSISTKAGSGMPAPSTVEFDNFQITPEPATLGLVGLGASVLRKRRQG